MPRIRTVALIIAAGTAFTLGAGSVGYAVAGTATTTKTVAACANKWGRLALKNSAGKCPKGFTAVTLNKQGPIGKQGPAGKQGLRGIPGPGSQNIYFSATSTEVSQAISVGEFLVTPQCYIDSGIAYTSVRIEPASAAKLSISGTSTLALTDSGTSTSIVDDSDATSLTYQLGAPKGSRSHRYLQGLNLFSSNGDSAFASLEVVGQSVAGDLRCEVKGTVIPNG
ncbi:hypothetical protein [Jatrophihabitans fulvus]